MPGRTPLWVGFAISISCPGDFQSLCLERVLRWPPALVWVEPVHLFHDFERVWSEVLLIHDAVMVHHKRLYASHPVFSRDSHQRKTPNHESVDHVIEFAERSIRALPFQDFEIVAMIRSRLVRVALLKGTRNAFADGPARCAVFVLPAQTIPFPGSADDFLRVLMKS